MSANLASLVNQQLYHAQLLLNMIEQQDAQALHYRAAKQALLNAAVQAVYLAYQGFLAETAESCQLKESFSSIEALDAALVAEGRSHAIVSNLKALTASSEFKRDQNWLQQLLKAHSGILQAAPSKPSSNLTTQLIIQATHTGFDHQNIQLILEDLKAFIDVQREYLQEW